MKHIRLHWHASLPFTKRWSSLLSSFVYKGMLPKTPHQQVRIGAWVSWVPYGLPKVLQINAIKDVPQIHITRCLRSCLVMTGESFFIIDEFDKLFIVISVSFRHCKKLMKNSASSYLMCFDVCSLSQLFCFFFRNLSFANVYRLFYPKVICMDSRV